MQSAGPARGTLATAQTSLVPGSVSGDPALPRFTVRPAVGERRPAALNTPAAPEAPASWSSARRRGLGWVIYGRPGCVGGG